MGVLDNLDITIPDPVRDQVEQLNDSAMAIIKDGRYGTAAALSMLRRALALRPESSDIWGNIGLVHWREDRITEASNAFRHAVELKPDSAIAQGNLGVFLSSTGDAVESDKHLCEAIRLNPDNLGPRWDRALLALRQGDWATGLPGYDIRREHRGVSLYPAMPAPFWRGEDLSGKSIYIQAEQGIGDRLLFSRYLFWMKEKWPTCRILVCLFDGLTNLFWEFRHIVEFLPAGVPWPDDLDYSTFLCSIAEIHGTTPTNIPPDPGLLLRRVRRAREKQPKCTIPLPNLPALKVGICWTGNKTQTRNKERSIPLELLLPLAEDPRLVLYSFQCSPGVDDIERLGAGDLICDLGTDIERQGWVATGLAMMEMDIMITVCTSIAHYAGVLNIPTWTLLCADPYWIWQRTEETTPWYPNSMRLFRQRTHGEWQPVIDQIKAELSKLADAKLNL